MFKKILIANRGEIAIRILRAAKEMGINTVTVYSEADKDSLHVLMSDESYCIGKAQSTKSYLNYKKILEVAKESHCDAVHPGYGFLSENSDFANKCEKENISFIGPPINAIENMGDKLQSRMIAEDAGVPLIPGSKEPVESYKEAVSIADGIGYPVMIKASAGGGGKGMRLVEKKADLENSFKSARREAKNAFGDDRVYIEKFLEEPHHIEIQIAADKHGNYYHLNERECSVQRRHQKVIEETPSTFINDKLRTQIAESALKIAKKVKYYSVGTVEFLVDKHKKFYFLEMNTRLQVEHAITEMVTGIDLVKLMIKIAQGEKIKLTKTDIEPKGHAIECRIYAEDTLNNFSPSPGKITIQKLPTNPGIRVDNGIYSGFTVPIFYDPMIAKLISWGKTREEAIQRMIVALNEYKIGGIKTNLLFHEIIIKSEYFTKGGYDTKILEEFDYKAELIKRRNKVEEEVALAAAVLFLKDTLEKKGTDKSSSPNSNWKKAGKLEALFTKSFRNNF